MATVTESTHHWRQDLAVTLLVTLGALALLQPGILLGAVLTALWWRWAHPPLLARWIITSMAATGAAFGAGAIVWVWPWSRLWADVPGTGPQPSPNPPSVVLGSIFVEALAGPLWLAGWRWVHETRGRRPGERIERERRAQEKRRQRLAGTETVVPLPSFLAPLDHSTAHPPGFVRLGTNIEGRRPFDLALEYDLGQHVTILGKPGTGKTTTAARLAEGVLTALWPVVIVDAKGVGSLRQSAEELAQRFGLPFRLVAPEDERSLRYNPCSGTPAQVSNKLIGAFSFGDNAEIYKQIAQEVLPVLIRARQLTGEPVTLRWLQSALDHKKMNGVAVAVGDKDQALRELIVDFGNRGNLYQTAYAGMRARLGALLQGEFGPLFEHDDDAPALNLGDALVTPGVTYISLPVMAGSEDVELMARVLAQDIKQVAASRIARGIAQPALLILDEFAGLREAEQLNDLLLQAREARLACVVCTQFLPHPDKSASLRNSLMSAGMFIAHQCSPVDAEDLAGLFGTRTAPEITHQVDYDTGYSQKGSVRDTEHFRMHPNELRELRRGLAAVRVEPQERRIALVQVQPVESD